jgi:hypothetical protein
MPTADNHIQLHELIPAILDRLPGDCCVDGERVRLIGGGLNQMARASSAKAAGSRCCGSSSMLSS